MKRRLQFRFHGYPDARNGWLWNNASNPQTGKPGKNKQSHLRMHDCQCNPGRNWWMYYFRNEWLRMMKPFRHRNTREKVLRNALISNESWTPQLSKGTPEIVKPSNLAMNRYEHTKQFILGKLQSGLPAGLTYHGYHHAGRIELQPKCYVTKKMFPPAEKELVRVCSSFHDSGFMLQCCESWTDWMRHGENSLNLVIQKQK